jgi:hypothetical protein
MRLSATAGRRLHHQRLADSHAALKCLRFSAIRTFTETSLAAIMVSVQVGDWLAGRQDAPPAAAGASASRSRAMKPAVTGSTARLRLLLTYCSVGSSAHTFPPLFSSGRSAARQQCVYYHLFATLIAIWTISEETCPKTSVNALLVGSRVSHPLEF